MCDLKSSSATLSHSISHHLPRPLREREGIVDIAPTIDTKSVLITPLLSKRWGDGEKLAAEVEKGVYEADVV